MGGRSLTTRQQPSSPGFKRSRAAIRTPALRGGSRLLMSCGPERDHVVATFSSWAVRVRELDQAGRQLPRVAVVAQRLIESAPQFGVFAVQDHASFRLGRCHPLDDDDARVDLQGRGFARRRRRKRKPASRVAATQGNKAQPNLRGTHHFDPQSTGARAVDGGMRKKSRRCHRRNGESDSNSDKPKGVGEIHSARPLAMCMPVQFIFVNYLSSRGLPGDARSVGTKCRDISHDRVRLIVQNWGAELPTGDRALKPRLSSFAPASGTHALQPTRACPHQRRFEQNFPARIASTILLLESQIRGGQRPPPRG